MGEQGFPTMLAPIAALVFAAAMALSLSVEGESFFHEGAATDLQPSNAAPEPDPEPHPPK
jgi:hypothetical protein